MKFNLRINPDWKVIDAKTGLELTFVRWVDDQTHQVAWCECARSIEKGGTNKAMLAAIIGASSKEIASECEDDRYIKAMPKVKIDASRKTVLVNVDESIVPAEFSRDHQMPMRRQAFAILIAA